jgi:TonB family protein
VVQRELERNYPPLLRDAGIGGDALMWLYIDETGRARITQLNESTGYPALDEAAARVAATMEFTPALNRSRPVPVWVQIPVKFSSGVRPMRLLPASSAVQVAAIQPAEMQISEISPGDAEAARANTPPDASNAVEARLRELTARIQRSEPRVSAGTVRRTLSRVDDFVQSSTAPMRVSATTNEEAERAVAEFTEAPRLVNEAEISRLLDRNYPHLLKNAGIGGQVILWFHIDDRGRVNRTVLQRSSHYPALDEAAIRIAESMRFAPARNGKDPVDAWVQVPITFGER